VVQLPEGTLRASALGAFGDIRDVAVAPDGAALAVAGRDYGGSRLCFARLNDGCVSRADVGLTGPLAFTPDGARILVGASLREVASGREVVMLTGEEVTAVAVSLDGARAVLGLATGEVRVYELAGGTQLLAIPAHKKAVAAVGCLPDGETIFSAGADLWGRLWNADDGAPAAKLKHGRAVLAAAGSPDGQVLATASADKRIHLWDTSDGREVRTTPPGRFATERLAWSPDGSVLAAALRTLIELWNPLTGKLLASLKGHSDRVNALAFTPDGTLLLTGSADRTVRLWGLA
jgi:WD40 repeat protein